MESHEGMTWDRWIGPDAGQAGMEHRSLSLQHTSGVWETQLGLSEQTWCIVRGGGSIRVAAMGECCEIVCPSPCWVR
eukprot:3687965-Prorocentrum_lima.AAC.1